MARDSGTDAGLLNAALIGYQVQRDRIAALIADIQAQLGRHGRQTAEDDSGEAAPVRRGRKPIGRPAAAGKPKRKRKMSAEGRARIVAATKARWEAFREAKAQKSASKRSR